MHNIGNISNIDFIKILGIIIAIYGFIKSGIFQKKPNLDVTFYNHEKSEKLIIGNKSEIGFQLINHKEISLISEINFCIPNKQFNIEVKKNGSIDFTLPICGTGHIAITFPLNEYRLGTYGEDLKATRMFSFFIIPRELGTFKISAVVDAKVDILSLKFPFNHMPEKKTRIRYQLVVEVVDKI